MTSVIILCIGLLAVAVSTCLMSYSLYKQITNLRAYDQSLELILTARLDRHLKRIKGLEERVSAVESRRL